MKFKLFFFIFNFYLVHLNLTTLPKKKPYSAKGFVYIYNEFDFNKKIIKRKNE